MPPSHPIKVSIIEDHSGTRQMLAALIGGSPGFTVTGAHATAEAALKHLPFEKSEVVLLDLELPKMQGEEFVPALKARLPNVKILVLTIHHEPERIFTALEAGATGYLVKPVPPARILEALADLHAGGSPMSSQIARLVVKTFHDRGKTRRKLEQLTPREEEILHLFTEGFEPKEVADKLRISIRTVGTHLRSIYDKLQVHSRAAAVAKYLQT